MKLKKKMNNFKNKRIAIYGGTFNPIHIGHLITGYDLIEKLKYDYVIYIPTNIPSHKKFMNISNQKYRFEMIKLSIKGINNFLASDIELKKGGISYTIDTVKELKQIYDYTDKFGVVFGDDLLKDLESWKEIDSLCKITDMICMFRNNSKKNNSRYKIQWLENRIINISSTEIRDRINNNLPIKYLVTDNVNKYILKNKVYRDYL
jgi:nicotinate-nucleotide adenylyltransferase